MVPFCQIPDKRIARYALSKGDIVFARTGATTGKSFLIRSCPLAVFASYLIRVRANRKVIPEYLYLFFQSDDYWSQISENISGSAQPNCDASKLATLTLTLPALAEQIEIVKQVDQLSALADQLEGRLENAREHTGGLSQSILAKAFSGELVQQDPDDEPASALLERIRVKKGQDGKPRRR